MRKIGLAIALNKTRNIHSNTFLEAVNYSLKNFSVFRRNKFKLVDDAKSAEGGLKAAQELSEWGADIVVGHYSSIAAKNAASIYSKFDIPLLLPASTDCELDDLYDKKILKYQINNKEVIKFCCDYIKQKNPNNAKFIIQNNHYGESFRKFIPDSFQKNINDIGLIEHSTIIIIGYHDFALQTIKRINLTNIKELIIFDDAYTDELKHFCLKKNLCLTRIRSLCNINNKEHEKNNTLFWNETLLALALSCDLNCQNFDKLITENIDTYLGFQTFNGNKLYKHVKLILETMS